MHTNDVFSQGSGEHLGECPFDLVIENTEAFLHGSGDLIRKLWPAIHKNREIGRPEIVAADELDIPRLVRVHVNGQSNNEQSKAVSQAALSRKPSQPPP